MTGGANFLQALGWAVFNSLWQIAILWLVYLAVNGLHRKASAGFKSWLATVLLFSGFAWFLFTLLIAMMSNPAEGSVINAAIIGAAGNENVNQAMLQYLPYASTVYLVLLLIPVLRFIRNYRYVSVIRKHGLSKMPVDWRLFVKKVSEQIGITKPVRIWISEYVTSPVTVGYIKPVILVPIAAMNQLTTQQLEAVLLHELAHIRRYDYLVNLLINGVRVILYFNPFVTAFVKTIEREREKSCDEMVLQFRYDSYDYAAALLALEKSHHAQRALALASAGKRNDLLHRVETILGMKNRTVISLKKLAGLVASIILLFGFTAIVSVKEKSADKKTTAYAHFSSPFTPITGSYSPAEQPNTIEHSIAGAHDQLIGSDATMESSSGMHGESANAGIASAELPIDGIIPVSYMGVPVAPVVPNLTNEQELQVKEAIEASRKVLENEQWKVVEKNIGEVFTEKEKEALKSKYHSEVSRFDWKKWENNLKMAYGKVDWEHVNYQLENALKQMTIDSLHRVYNEAFVELSKVRKELTETGLNGIPDTDISLREVDSARRQAQKALRVLKSNRNKKIAHL